MNNEVLNREAVNNLAVLAANPYPGRGLILGRDSTGKYLVQVYWIMGRSESSRNRLFKENGSRLFTNIADPEKASGDASLIIYNAMMELHKHNVSHFVVSNGRQTDALIQRLEMNQPLPEGLWNWNHEPDAPNFTPRITGHLSIEGRRQYGRISVITKSKFDDDTSDHFLYEFYKLQAGFGYCVTTYAGDAAKGERLPPFEGQPLLVPIKGDLGTVLDTYWSTLNEPNRISCAVKFINTETRDSTIRFMNKYRPPEEIHPDLKK